MLKKREHTTEDSYEFAQAWIRDGNINVRISYSMLKKLYNEAKDSHVTKIFIPFVVNPACTSPKAPQYISMFDSITGE